MQNQETKKQILEKSALLFSKKGYFGVSMEDIASSVGVKKSALYYHFPNKEGLLKELLDSCLLSMKNTLEKSVKKSNNPFDLWYNLVYDLLDFRFKHPEIMLLNSFGFLQKSDIPALQYMINIRNEFINVVKDIAEFSEKETKNLAYVPIQLINIISNPLINEVKDLKKFADEYSRLLSGSNSNGNK